MVQGHRGEEGEHRGRLISEAGFLMLVSSERSAGGVAA